MTATQLVLLRFAVILRSARVLAIFFAVSLCNVLRIKKEIEPRKNAPRAVDMLHFDCTAAALLRGTATGAPKAPRNPAD